MICLTNVENHQSQSIAHYLLKYLNIRYNFNNLVLHNIFVPLFEPIYILG